MWPATTLGDVTDTGQYGLNAAALKEGGGIRFIRITDIDSSGQLGGASPAYVDAKLPDLERYMLSAGDLLIARSGATAGKSLLFRGLPEPAVFAGYLIRFKARVDRVLPEYLGHFLQSPLYWGFIRKISRAVAQPNVNARELASLPVPLPPVAEQQRIVELLTRAENIVRMRREAEQKAKEIIPALFLDMFGDPAKNPKGWVIQSVSSIGRVQLGRQRAPKYQSGKFTRPYMRVANVHENRIDTSDVLSMDFDDKDYAQYLLCWGDILLNEGQSIELVGRPAMWRNEISNCCFQNTLVRFQPSADRMTPQFALALFLKFYKDGALSKISSKTSNVAHLGAARFARLSVICPPLQRQIAFSDHFDRACELEASQTSAVTISRVTFQSLLARMFSVLCAT